jgi:nucleoside-diphosphate-sugar epimerase
MSAERRELFRGKRIVIFGAGYIGSALAAQAVEHGLRVTALTRNPEKADCLRRAGIETVVADLADSAWHAQIAPSPDFVVNCVSSGDGGVAGYRRSYFDGTQSIAAWAAQSDPIGTFVYTSSTSVYPQGGGATITEDDPANPGAEGPQILRQTEELIAGTLAQ